ncbi:MAG: zinc-binding dehydrogenase, partial [Prosthecobacter sp.]|nr:zinc-binding dehydrogenase [Prosthecobacter sp.]
MDPAPVLQLIQTGQMPEHQLILREHLYVPRLTSLEAYNKTHHHLPPPEAGQYLVADTGIETLHWAERTTKTMAADEVSIRILATALNFRDVLKAMQLYPGEAGDFGYECAGEVLATGSKVTRVKAGDKVIVTGTGLFGTDVIVSEHQVYLMPDNLTPEQGASLPIVFLTANYGLNILAKLKKGQKVLIHAATGGVGLAAIALAKLAGAEVYATTSAGKQAWLKEHLNVEQVFDSRSTAFKEHLKDMDVILNSLTGEGFIEASLSCLKEGGTFLEIGKLNIYSKAEMSAIRPDVNYHIIALDKRMQEEPEQVREEMTGILSLFAANKLQALPIKTFTVSDTMEAFHYLQHAKQIG